MTVQEIRETRCVARITKCKLMNEPLTSTKETIERDSVRVIVDENVKNEFKEGDSENMHDEDDYSCKVEEDVIHQELILNENPVILL